MKEKSIKALLDAIDDCIGGTRGDPIQETLVPAAHLVEVLTREGHINRIGKDVLDVLRGDNIEKRNYLEYLGYPKK